MDASGRQVATFKTDSAEDIAIPARGELRAMTSVYEEGSVGSTALGGDPRLDTESDGRYFVCERCIERTDTGRTTRRWITCNHSGPTTADP